MLKILADNIKENRSNLYMISLEDKIKLERLQYEIYVNLGMYVEALDASGLFCKNDEICVKSDEKLYEKFLTEVNERNEEL